MLSFMEREQPCCCCQFMLSTQPERDPWAASQELCCAVVTLPWLWPVSTECLRYSSEDLNLSLPQPGMKEEGRKYKILGAEFGCSFSSEVSAKESRLSLELQNRFFLNFFTETNGSSHWKF